MPNLLCIILKLPAVTSVKFDLKETNFFDSDLSSEAVNCVPQATFIGISLCLSSYSLLFLTFQ